MRRVIGIAMRAALIACACWTSGSLADEINYEFQLATTDGEAVAVKAGDKAPLTVVCFLGTECPLARLYGPRLDTLSKTLQSHGVRFIGVMSNRQDSIDDIREYAIEHDIEFPIVKDLGNVVADQYTAERTPEVFVLDEHLALRYRGRIDDQYEPGVARSKATRDDLRLALEELLAGKPVSEPWTEPTGCFIGRVKEISADTNITYTNQVSRVLLAHCIECHRPGEIGPFSLTDYDEVVGWGDTIVEVIDDQRMPPWHASGGHRELLNARTMPEADKQLLRDWVAAGMPFGDAGEIPPLPSVTEGWQLERAPDVVLSMREQPFVVPAEGTVEYQYFVVDPGFTEDKWIKAAQLIPDNRSVVHHGIVFVRPPDGSTFKGVGWLTAYVPGQRLQPVPDGMARRVPANSKLVFQMHYTPTGREQQDLSRVGIIFEDESRVTHELYTLLAMNQQFEIPPHADDFAVEARLENLPAKAELLAIAPHMHLRGKAFRAAGVRGDDSEILLEVPRYDFNWQHIYRLAQPIPLSTLDSIKIAAIFNNSESNPVNPDASQRVTWGDQTWEEMAVAFFEVAEPLASRGAARSTADEDKDASSADPQKINEFVAHFMARFDTNQDGAVHRLETPLSLRNFGFGELDRDGNDQLSPREVRDAAMQRPNF